MEKLYLNKEHSLVKKVAEYFSGKNFKVYFEVPIFTKICDILCFNPKTNSTIAIEVKISKWRDAIKQARVYQFGADEVFIAMPESFIHRIQNNQNVPEKYGIGIISVDNNVKIKLKPSKNYSLIDRLKNETIESIDYLEREQINNASNV